MAKKLQVFISSTYNDLIVERQAAVAAVLKAGHIPAGMELFTSGDQSQLDTIKAWIDESDVYMLILGGRYGSIEPITGKSYTELEFDYAVSRSKPMFSVVINQKAVERKVQAGGTSFVETMNGAALELFRNKVLSYISSFFDDEKDIKLTVYESLADFSAKKELVGWVRGNTVVDTLPLFDEIKKLSDENAGLRSKVAELERQKKGDQDPKGEFNLLYKILLNEKITVPKTASEAGPFELSLLNVLLQVQKQFSTGVENPADMSDFLTWLFFEVAPRLQIHGLVHYEKITGSRIRRCALTEKGAQFLSEFAKRKLEKSSTSPQAVADSSENVTSPTVEEPIDEGTAKPPKKPRKATSK